MRDADDGRELLEVDKVGSLGKRVAKGLVQLAYQANLTVRATPEMVAEGARADPVVADLEQPGPSLTDEGPGVLEELEFVRKPLGSGSARRAEKTLVPGEQDDDVRAFGQPQEVLDDVVVFPIPDLDDASATKGNGGQGGNQP